MQSAHSQDINNDNSGRRSSPSTNLLMNPGNPGPASSSGACLSTSTSTNMQHPHDTGAAHSVMPHYNSNFATLFPPLQSSNNQWQSYNHHQLQHLFPINFRPPAPFLNQASLFQNQQQQQHLIPQQNPSEPLDMTMQNGLTGTIDMPTNTTTTTSPTEEAELDLATNTSTNTSTATAPFNNNDVFPSEQLFKQAVEDYCVTVRMFPKQKKTENKRTQADNYISYRYTCPRSGTHKSQKKEGIKGARPTRQSLKTGCEWHISAARERMPNDACRNDEIVRITSVSLEHTNGCNGGDDQEMIFALRKRAGRTYPDYALAHLRKEVKARRYGTDDVKSWLIQSGFLDATLEEATNLRYRLLNDEPIKNWKPNECSKEEIGQWTDYLHNEDLANEISAGSKDSIDNLLMLHRGLKEEVDGYDSRVTTDSEHRFSGTAWQTGRMRARLLRHGAMIFIDDTRSGVNTSNFCFWNVMVSDHEGKSQTVMGAMTMCASNEAVSWVLQSLVTMSPFAAEIVKATMSDLGKYTTPLFMCASQHHARSCLRPNSLLFL